MKLSRWLLRAVFYVIVSALVVSRAVSAGINHDENQFISPGQLLADHGLLPYLDYPYTHMPYAIPFYALAVGVSHYDYLATRLLGVLTWMACMAVLVAIFRLVGRGLSKEAVVNVGWAALIGEFALIAVFVEHPLSIFLQGSALNHVLGTLFALLALLMFLCVVTAPERLGACAFWSGVFGCIAALVRLNYASILPVLAVLWLIYVAVSRRPGFVRVQAAFFGGMLAAAAPAAILAAAAPAQFYYGNIVYIQLNTLYYQGMRLRETMDLASKASVFLASVAQSPISMILYGAAIVAAVLIGVRLIQRRFSMEGVTSLAALGFAGALWLSSFAPTPSQLQYFFAPLPFLLVHLSLPAWKLFRRSVPAGIAASLLVMALAVLTSNRLGPAQELQVLLHRDRWPPLQIHDFAGALSSHYDIPPGRILAILPMIPSEAGYASYPFTATGPFSWRTSVLLSEARRAQYGVTSPEELPLLLDASPPVAILTGLEPRKAGFSYQDSGGLERPFSEYAEKHGYTPVSVYAQFLQRTVTIWVRRP